LDALGLAVVPVEPTEAMIAAAYDDRARRLEAALVADRHAIMLFPAEFDYRAMIAASKSESGK